MASQNSNQVKVTCKGKQVWLALNPHVDNLGEEGYFSSTIVRTESRKKGLNYVLVGQSTFTLTARQCFVVRSMIYDWSLKETGEHIIVIPFDDDVYICTLTNNPQFIDIDYGSEQVVDLETAKNILGSEKRTIIVAHGGELTEKFSQEGFEVSRNYSVRIDAETEKLYSTAPLVVALTRAKLFHPAHAVAAVLFLTLYILYLFLPDDFFDEDVEEVVVKEVKTTGTARIPQEANALQILLGKAKPLKLLGLSTFKYQLGTVQLKGSLQYPGQLSRLKKISTYFPEGTFTIAGSSWEIEQILLANHFDGSQAPTVNFGDVRTATDVLYQWVSSSYSLTQSSTGSPTVFPIASVEPSGNKLETNTIRIESIVDMSVFLDQLANIPEIGGMAGHIISLESQVTDRGFTGATITLSFTGTSESL